jgi:hypothetical protein
MGAAALLGCASVVRWARDVRRPPCVVRNGPSLGSVAASRSLRLTRAELRAAAGRCAEALADYEALLTTAGRPDERALRGREACRKRLTGAQQPSSP